MRSILVIIFLLSFVSTSAAESFKQRVETARALERTEKGKAYEKVLIEAVSDYMAIALQECISAGTKTDAEHFVFVADLTSNHSLNDVEVQPKTRMAQCFAEKFSEAPFPDLPSYAAPNSLPIVFDINTTY